jgi:hypothetical protein
VIEVDRPIAGIAGIAGIAPPPPERRQPFR